MPNDWKHLEGYNRARQKMNANRARDAARIYEGGATVSDVAQRFGVSLGAMSKWLNRIGYKMRTPGEALRRDDPTCSVDECPRDAHTSNTPDGIGQVCLMHYKRLKRGGSLDARPKRPSGTPEDEWFWRFVTKTPDCWTWTGATYKSRGGYGSFYFDGKRGKAHHFLVGRPVKGHHWHHRCGNVLCVRPEHLELLSISEHSRMTCEKRWHG